MALPKVWDALRVQMFDLIMLLRVHSTIFELF